MYLRKKSTSHKCKMKMAKTTSNVSKNPLTP